MPNLVVPEPHQAPNTKFLHLNEKKAFSDQQKAVSNEMAAQVSQLTLNPSSSCFVPRPSQKVACSAKSSDSDAAQETASSGKAQPQRKEGYHAGSATWGKYKKKEREAKKRRALKRPDDTSSEQEEV